MLTDIDADAVSLAVINAKREVARVGARSELKSAPIEIQGRVGSMFEPLALAPSPVYDVIFFNPPQTGGPPLFAQMRPDKYGGVDGADYFVSLAAEASAYLAYNGRVVFSIIGLANLHRVEQAFADHDFECAVLQSQRREFDEVSMEKVCSGLFAYQITQRGKNQAMFEHDEASGRCTMEQKVVMATKKAKCSYKLVFKYSADQINML